MKMEWLSYIGNKGQAATLDLAIFLSICIISLSYLFIQATSTSASTLDVLERENINEVAMKAIDSLAQSSGAELELKTVQPIALKEVNSGFSNDIRTLLGYAETSIGVLDEVERDLRNGKNVSLDSPYLAYFKARANDVSGYLDEAGDLVTTLVADWLDKAESNLDGPCGAIDYLSQLLPGYDNMDMSCSGIVSGFLDDLVDTIENATDISTGLEDMIDQQLQDLADLYGEDLADAIQDLRCELTEIKETCNSLLSYLETGLDMDVSFLELWPVEAKTGSMTLEKLLGDAMIIGDSFVHSDDLRAVGGAAGLLLLRENDSVDGNVSTEVEDEVEQINGSMNETEDVIMIPQPPLIEDTSTTSEGPYNNLTFGAETYLTSSGKLAVRLKVWGNGIGGIKQKSNYFEGFDYIMNTSVYLDSTHSRKYNGSFVKGRVIEDKISVLTTTWVDATNLTDEITALTEFEEVRLQRPMLAKVNFTYENQTWPEGAYNFDIEHYRITQDSDYLINLSKQDDCEDCDNSEALKSIILGIILTHRADIKTRLAEMIEERLNELLEGYNYRFEVGDCCETFLTINEELEPEGTVGLAKYYFIGDNSRAEMNLTVWR